MGALNCFLIFSWAFVEFETSNQYPVVRAKDLFLNHGFFLCSSVTKDQFNYYNCSILVWFGDVLDIMIRKSSWHIWKISWLCVTPTTPMIILRTLKQNPLNFQVMLKCKTQYFQGYFNMEETVLDLWPRVKDAQVLPTSIYVNSCVCPRNSSSKSAYCRLVAQNPIPAGK